jgi:hypothetical protein
MAVRRSERKNMGSISVENVYRMALTLNFPELLINALTGPVGFPARVPKNTYLGKKIVSVP